MEPSQLVETYKFWDVAALWARERLENELVVGRALARGIVVDGLRFQSIDPRWVKSDRSLSGYPYIGYAAIPDALPVLLRAEALEHLLAVVRREVRLALVRLCFRDDDEIGKRTVTLARFLLRETLCALRLLAGRWLAALLALLRLVRLHGMFLE